MGVIFFPLASAHLSLLQSGLPVEGREGRGRWQHNPMPTQPAPRLLTPLSSPPQKENGSRSTRAIITNLALLLPDRAQPSPARSH